MKVRENSIAKSLDELRMAISGSASLSPSPDEQQQTLSPVFKPSEMVGAKRSKSTTPDVSNRRTLLNLTSIAEEGGGDRAALETHNTDEADEEEEEEDNTNGLGSGEEDITKKEAIRSFVIARFSSASDKTPSTESQSAQDGTLRQRERRYESILPLSHIASPAAHSHGASTSLLRRLPGKGGMNRNVVHPRLLEKICHEWMASLPWRVIA